MDSYLSHHGILGQKCGVRRYQNEDGTLTPAGRERKMYRDRTVRAGKTKDAVDGIISTMTSDEKDKLAIDKEGYLSFEQGSSVCKRILKKHGDTPVAFFDVLDDGDTFQLSMGTRSGKDFRGKGYASKAASEGVAWMNKNYSKYGKKKAVWGVRVDNNASIRIAEKNGFVIDKNSYSEDGKWVNYEKKFKHSLFAEDHLEHHGILGQKWGVRRYQNYDGTLTPAGRERYGESKQLASQLFEKAKAHEPRITKDVTDSIKGTTAKMYGLEHKLKTEESLTRKIRTDSEEKKITPFDAASDIKDGVRYTALSPDNDFTSNYYKIKDSLEKKGYSEVRCKNYFDLYRQGQVKHKSVQSVFQSDDGYLFEMQFQTPASQDAKDKKVPIYEERRKPGLSKERQEALERQMVELAENVPDPKDVYKIKTHSGIKHSLGGDSMNYDELVHALFTEEPPKDDHLEHHGILGMKWYHRRFQNEDGSLTPAGRERYGVGEAREGSSDKPKKAGLIERHKQKKEEKRKAAEKAARVKRMQEGKAKKAEERKSAEEHEAAKQKALTSGKATEVLKYRDELSNQEVKDALSRVEWEKALRKNAKEENPDAIDKAMKVIERYGGYAKTVGDAVGNSANAYNNIAKVMNTFAGSDWPMIDKKMTRNERIRDEELTKQALIKTQRESEGLSQDREKTKQAREATSQAYEATTQAEEATIQSKQKTMQGAEDISQASEKTKQEREYTKQERYKTTQESERSKQEQYKTAQESERSKQEEERSNQQRERTTQAKQRTMEGAEGVSQASERTKQERENTTQAKQRTMAGAEGVSQASERTKQERYKTTQEKYKAEQERQKAEQAKRTADSWTSSKSYTDIVSRPMDSSSSEEAQKTGEHWVFNSSYLPLGLPDKRKRFTDSKG